MNRRRIVATVSGLAGLAAAVAIPFAAAGAASAEQDGVRLHGTSPASTILGGDGRGLSVDDNHWGVMPSNKSW